MDKEIEDLQKQVNQLRAEVKLCKRIITTVFQQVEIVGLQLERQEEGLRELEKYLKGTMKH